MMPDDFKNIPFERNPNFAADANVIGETDGEIKEIKISETGYVRGRKIVGRDENGEPVIVEVCI